MRILYDGLRNTALMQQVQEIISQVRKVVVGKDPVIASILMAMLAQGHVLLEDVPGVGKTTMALAFSRTMDLSYKRMQFTPDVMPSDITGYTTIQTGGAAGVYVPGAGMIPSRRHRLWNAASASSSVMVTYSARPESLSQACSGPTPG